MAELLPGSEFPGPPPWHMQCRSVLIPITKTWNELAKRTDLPEPPASTRASMDGQVAADMNYEQWLKTKPEAFQRQVLGPGRHQMWKDGKITFPQLIDQSGRPLNLQQLAAVAAVPQVNWAVATGKEMREELLRRAEPIQTELDSITAELESLHQERVAVNVKHNAADDDIRKRTESGSDERRSAIEANRTSRFDTLKPHEERASMLRRKRWPLLKEQNAIAHELLKVEDGIVVDLKLGELVKSNKLSLDQPNVQEALKFFQENVHQSMGVQGRGRARSLRVEINQLRKRARAHAYPEFGRIHITKDEDKSTILHELGHLLERRPQTKKAVRRFLEKRARADKVGLQKLSKLFPGHGYESWEKAWKDKFMHAYMGKHYDDGFTEIFSKGLDTMMTNPYKFAREDPEMFDFMVNLMRGRFPGL